MKKIILSGFIYLLVLNSAFAQFDTIVNNYKKEFDQFNQSIEQEHQQFKNKNDSVFAKFLKDSWEEFDVLYKKKDSSPKPLVQPVVKGTPKSEPLEIELEPKDSIKTSNSESEDKEINPEKGTPATELGSSGTAMLNVGFYGTNTETLRPGNLPGLRVVSSDNISNYFEKTCDSSDIKAMVDYFQKTKKKLQLNDWGYYKLIDKTAKLVETNENMQTLFNWIILIKSGYSAKVAYSANKIYLLLPIKEKIFNSYVLEIDNVIYNIQVSGNNKQQISKLTAYKGNYPDNKLLSLAMKRLPVLRENTTNTWLKFRDKNIAVPNNINLKDFYADYPFCEMSVYFSAPLSAPLIQTMENYFNPLFVNQTEEHKVSVLLEFVQSAFSYKTDKEQFNCEKYFFPDELFFYPFSDCEDRSVLFARLIKHFINLDCIALNFPGHVNTAVSFSKETDGTYITYNNKKYTICDPTYLRAPIGYLASEYKNKKAEIITFD